MNTTTNILRGRRGTRGTRGTRGFTLVEILIVVIILGILAAIVIPQFSNATSDARNSNVQTQVQTVRQAIALYGLQHNGAYPNLVAGWTQMTEYTDATGTNVSATADTAHPYGPYLPSAPINPLISSTTTNSTVAVDASTGAGWIYNQGGGQFAATAGVNLYFNETDGTTSGTRPW